jgi:polyisoprenoid-binding protein YceI
MGFPVWDAQLASEGYFDTENYPTMTDKSAELIFDGDRLTGADGFLTLLGVSKPVRLAVSNFKCGVHLIFKKPMCGAEISTTIRRIDFGMTKDLSLVGDEVRIYAPIEAMTN